MILSLIRKTKTVHSTIGELLIDGKHFCYTLEPPVLEPPTKPRAIPEGTYAIKFIESPRFGRLMPHLIAVPNFIGVLMHWGNFPKDTEGCILVGESIDSKPDMIDTSRVAFDKLVPLIQEASSISIEITNEYPAATV